MSCFQKAAFSKRRVKKKKEQPVRREGMVSQGADMKVYLEGSERHHDAGSALHQKTTTNLFTHTVVSHKWSRIYTVYITFYTNVALLLFCTNLLK